MASKRGGEHARARAKAAAAPGPTRLRVDLAKLAPSGPSLAVGFALLALGVAAYGVARETSLFAIERIEVVGAPPEVQASVTAALAPLEGKSLVGLHRDDVDNPLAAVPDVAGATYDRAFPHTLRVFVLAEQPLAVVRRGADSWLVSTRGRVLRRLQPRALAGLPRLWVRRSVAVERGGTLGDATAQRGVRVLAAAAEALPAAVRTVRLNGAEATVVLRSGVEIRLGTDAELPLKLAVAASVLPRLAPTERYLDVAVPARPVAGSESQPQVEIESHR